MGLADVGAVRPGNDRDARRAAELHTTSLSEGFLATLGPGFLRRLYSCIVRSSHGFLLVAASDADTPEATEPENMLGFVAGATDVRRLYRHFLLRHGAPAAFFSTPRLVRALPRTVETLRYGTRDQAAGPSGVEGEVELLALAVDDAHRRRGIGSSLVRAFLDTASASGAPSARVVVGAANEEAIKLYCAAGFELAYSLEVHHGAASLVLRTSLPAAVPG
jgi:ribosomal protein S18 acetylase RimI-like enzyme